MKRPVTWEMDEDDDDDDSRSVHVAAPARDPVFASLAAKPMRRQREEKSALKQLALELDSYAFEDDDEDDDVTMVHDSWLLPPPTMPSLRVHGQETPSLRVKAFAVQRLVSLRPTAMPPRPSGAPSSM